MTKTCAGPPLMLVPVSYFICTTKVALASDHSPFAELKDPRDIYGRRPDVDKGTFASPNFRVAALSAVNST